MDNSTAIKHRIKRVGRFCCNDGIDPELASQCLVEAIVKHSRTNVTAVDWTYAADCSSQPGSAAPA